MQSPFSLLELFASGQTAGLNWAWLSSQAYASSFGIHGHQVRVGLGLKAKLRQHVAFARSGAQAHCPTCRLHPRDLGGVGTGVGLPSVGHRQRRGRQEGPCDSYPFPPLWDRTPSGPCLAAGCAEGQGLLIHLCVEGSVGLLPKREWRREDKVNFQRPILSLCHGHPARVPQV